MKTIKTIAIAALAATTIGGFSLPASAAAPHDHRYEQTRRGNDTDRRVEWRIQTLENRLGQNRRTLSRSEYSRLNTDLRDIKSLARKYERSGRGLDRQEVATLERRLNAFEQRLYRQTDNRHYGYRR